MFPPHRVARAPLSDDILITCGVPKPYTVVEQNAPICKIQLLKSALDPYDKRSFSSEARTVVSHVYEKLALEDTDKVEMAEVG